MKRYFAYTRVSTMKQGEHGVSLQEQKSEIERYAQQKSLYIGEWIEDRETAAKRGRVIFDAMMIRLRNGEADGVIIHKIDRSARNLRDWVDIGQLTDDGIEVHFTREALDLQSSSGRLSADVQAVVAANYIRNLREETIKGFYGRLKQGISPLPAPLGYLDAGKGKPKTIDPDRGPLIRQGFNLYATGQFSLFALKQELARLGLRTKRGELVSKNTLAGILGNPFYYGLIRVQKNNQTFAGIHEPLISKDLFDRVREVAAGRSSRTVVAERRSFLFSRMIRCKVCGRSLIAEMQKGHVYYRCHSQQCKGTSIREADIDLAVTACLKEFRLGEDELSELDRYVQVKRSQGAEVQRNQISELEFKLAGVKQRLNRLTDAYLDGHVTVDMLNQRKETLLAERLDLEGRINELKQNSSRALERMEEFVELVKGAHSLYKLGNLSEKRKLIEKVLSNRQLDGKSIVLSIRSELLPVAVRHGDPSAVTHRTSLEDWIDDLTNSKAA